ncbi:MAG: formate dehydrogenase subunit gamma, partial [Pseudomonadota bacterium]|nr:formate dehydrogenase subunit gamma [Pseudomonadota bacterium]
MLRLAFAILMQLTLLTGIATAQDSGAAAAPDRSATGGAQTLEDILARQRGEKIDDSFRSNDVGAGAIGAGITEQLGTLGGASDPELWRAIRYNAANLRVSAGGDVATVLVQDGGMRWLTFRDGPL